MILNDINQNKWFLGFGSPTDVDPTDLGYAMRLVMYHHTYKLKVYMNTYDSWHAHIDDTGVVWLCVFAELNIILVITNGYLSDDSN